MFNICSTSSLLKTLTFTSHPMELINPIAARGFGAKFALAYNIHFFNIAPEIREMPAASQQQDTVVATYQTHVQAEDVVKELEKSGVDMKQLSIIGRDYHSDEHVVGYYSAGDRMMYWGGLGAFCGGLWGLLFGAAFCWIPGVGSLF